MIMLVKVARQVLLFTFYVPNSSDCPLQQDEQLITIVKGANAPDITRIVKENLVVV